MMAPTCGYSTGTTAPQRITRDRSRSVRMDMTTRRVVAGSADASAGGGSGGSGGGDDDERERTGTEGEEQEAPPHKEWLDLVHDKVKAARGTGISRRRRIGNK